MAALVAFAAGALLALAAGPVLAVVEPDLHAYEVRLPLEQRSPVLSIPATDREAALLLPGLDAFRAAEGAGWRLLQWDPRLRAPACMAGPGIPLKAAGHSREALVAACEAFIRGKSGLLHARPEELRLLDSVDLGEGRTYIIFGQFVGGLEVVGGRLDIALRNGAVVLVGSNLYPDVAIDPVPAIDGGLAWRFAHDGIPWEATDQPLGESRLVILPLHRAGSIGHHLAWEVRLETGAPECVWRAYVDASDGEVLWRESERSYAQIRGSSTQDVEEKTVGDPYVRHPMRDGTIVAGGSHTGHTGVEGSFTIEVPDGGPIEVVAELRGRWCDIENRNGPDARIALTGVAGESFDFSFEDANSHAAERDAYHHMNVAHDWIKRIDPTFTGMDQIVPANVNVQNTCNAYWDGAALHFYREGGGCNNAGRISDVIYHEYGHGITQRIYAPLAPPAASGMGEAFSDIDAMSINGDPEVGEGFYAGGGFLRTGENLRQYPGTECAGQVHCLGEILMGAMWKARANLTLKHGQRAASLFDSLYIAAVKTKQATMPAFLTRLLMADDDDGDLGNGTPDWHEICEAFEAHALPCPALAEYVEIDFEPIGDQENEAGSYFIRASIRAVGGGAIDPEACFVYYTSDPPDQGPVWHRAPLAPTGNGDECAGEIPNQGCGRMVYYYLYAAKDTGEWATSPIEAPHKYRHRFLAGPVETALEDDCEADRGWTVGAPGDGATAGIWERVDPIGKVHSAYGPTQPEDDRGEGGTRCWVTDGRGGDWYHYDVDNGRTTLVSPLFDWSAYSGWATVGFWAFFFDYTPTDDALRWSVSNDDGAAWIDLGEVRGMGNNAWSYRKSYLSSDDVAFTDRMRFRFQMEDIGVATTCAEAALDDIQIRVTRCVAGGAIEGATPAAFVIEPNRPNPFRATTEIRFGLPRAGRIEIAIYDAGGRRVRTLLDEERAAGFHTTVWDGRDQEGRRVSSGVYSCEGRAGGRRVGRKALLLR